MPLSRDEPPVCIQEIVSAKMSGRTVLLISRKTQMAGLGVRTKMWLALLLLVFSGLGPHACLASGGATMLILQDLHRAAQRQADVDETPRRADGFLVFARNQWIRWKDDPHVRFCPFMFGHAKTGDMDTRVVCLKDSAMTMGFFGISKYAVDPKPDGYLPQELLDGYFGAGRVVYSGLGAGPARVVVYYVVPPQVRSAQTVPPAR